MTATQPQGPTDPATIVGTPPIPAPVRIDEAAYRTIVDSVAQMMWVNDAGGGVRFFNRFALAYIGRTNDELEGRQWLAYVHEDDRERLAVVRGAAVAAGEAYSVEGRFRRPDGAYRWQCFDVQPVRGDDGTIVAWIGSARDIEDDRHRDDERARLLAELAAQQALFETVYAQAPIGLTIADATGRMLRFNAEAERILGHPPVQATTVADLARYGAVHADGTRYGAEEYVTARALRGIVVRQELMRYRRANGDMVLLRVSGAPVRNGAGLVTHAVATFVDVTEREAAERALREREERLRAALDAARTGTFRWNIRTDALDWDENLDRLFGLEPGRTAHSLDQFIATVHPDDRDRVIAACVRCATEGADFDEEFRVVWPDGAIRWLHDLGRTYRDDDGRPLYMTGACVDVTERRQRQDELRALTESLPQLVWMADATGHVGYFNARWEQYTGLTVEQLSTGGQWPGTVHPDDEPTMRARWNRSIATGEPYEIVYRLRGADDSYRWFVGRAVAARDENGRVVRWFGSCTDIHDEVVGRERLRRLNEITEALAEARDAGMVASVLVSKGIEALAALAGSIALLDDDGETLLLLGATNSPAEVNEAWQRFPLGAPVPLAEVARTGEPLFLETREAILARYPQLASEVAAVDMRAAVVLPLQWSGRRLGSVSFLFAEPRRFDAGLRAFLETLARQCAQALERARLYALERRAREEAEAARAEAQSANVAKGQFLAMMSHDLRTPINATLGYLDLMGLEIRGPLTAEQRHDVERMQRSQRVLLALVNEVLDYTRVEAGRAEVRRDRLALRDIVADVVPIVEPLARQKGLTFDLAPVPDAAAIGDADRVRQVLLNLLSNAVKFTDAGGIIRLETEADERRVRVRVIDTGRGIPEERLPSVFEPFVQVERDADPTKRDGIGLGLAIARELARAMEGDLTATSVRGVGSRFTLSLPRG